MSCIIYTITTHATCLLTPTTYKYNELQVSFTTQKLSWKANCKTPIFFIVLNFLFISFSMAFCYNLFWYSIYVTMWDCEYSIKVSLP
jgi:hypothetical protein